MTYNGGRVFQTEMPGLVRYDGVENTAVPQEAFNLLRDLTPEVAEMLGNAQQAQTQGDLDEAGRQYRTALETLESSNKAEGPAGRYVLASLGHTLLQLQKFAEAESTFLRLDTLNTRLSGAEHASRMQSLIGLGNAHLGPHKYAEALDEMCHALAISEKTFGADRKETADALMGVGLALEATGDYRKAWESYSRAEQIYPQTVGADDDLTRDSREAGQRAVAAAAD